MPAPAAPYIEQFQLGRAAFAEGCGCLSDAAGLSKDEARPALAYGFQVITSGLLQIEALAKRYVIAPECAERSVAKPILADANFRAAALDCAASLEAAAAFIGLPGKRIAAALRRWVDASEPSEARAVAMAADAAVRLTKMKASRST